MASKNSVVIAVRPTSGGRARKLTKVIEYAEGGFAVLAPYHKAREGSVAKARIDVTAVGDRTIAHEQIDFFSASSRVKLSYHADGFCHFSGEATGSVISGRDLLTGAAKGVGVQTTPLRNPINSGPTFGLIAWGLDEFDELAEPHATAMIFEPEDLYLDKYGPSVPHSYQLEALVLPAVHWMGVRKRGQNYVLNLAVPHIGRNPRAGFVNVFEWKVFRLRKENVLIAFRMLHVKTSFDPRSGWELCGPTELSKTEPGIGRGLFAWYPKVLRDPSEKASIDRGRTK
jgi:hypothetical protein